MCRDKKPKREMTRVIKNDDEGLTYDLTGKKNGRGAYICLTRECIDKLSADKLGKALKCQVTETEVMQLKDDLVKILKDKAMM